MEIAKATHSPIGGVCENTKITITAHVLRRYSALVRLALFRDGEDREFFEMTWIGREKAYDIYEITLSLPSGLYWYTFDLWDYGVLKERLWQLTVYEKGFKTPDKFSGGIMYHIFVDRFNRGKETPIRDDVFYHENKDDLPHYAPNSLGIVENTDFYGGNIDGIINKLPYLRDLGVTILYLSPIFKANSNHKYDTGNYEEIDEMFGTTEDFERLVSQAREYGMDIICDGVFNHTGDDSLYFNKYGRYPSAGAYSTPDSPYADWYKFNHDRTDYESWWGIKILPCTEKEKSGFADYITGKNGIIERWTSLGISWRLDVADELPDSFLNKLRTAAKRQNPDCLIIGEVWEDASNKISYGARRRYLLGRQLDSVMNYPWKNAIIDYVINGNSKALKDAVNTLVENYPPQVLHNLMNILGTHDTPRILTVLSGNTLPEDKSHAANYSLSSEARALASQRLKIASLLQMTLPGIPCIYYGDEAGCEGCGDPFNRRYYPWGREDERIMSWYKKITAIRRSREDFNAGEFNLIYAEDGCFSFSRGKNTAVAVNASDTAITLPKVFDLISREYKTELLPLEGIIYDTAVIK